MFLFLLARAAPAFLPTALSVAPRPLFPFRQAQYAQVFPLNPSAILHARCWSRQHQQVCHFSSLLLLSDSRSVLATLSSPASFLLSQTVWQIWQELSSLCFFFYQATMGPRTLVPSRNDTADELAKVSTTTRPRLVFTSTRIDFPGIPKELILLRIQFSSIKFIKSYKKPYSNRINYT